MATEIIDLDELIAPPKLVKLGGATYRLPAEIPVPLYLTMKAEEKRAAENPDREEQDIVEAVHDQCLALFHVYQPDLEVIPVGIMQLMRLIPTLYGGGEEAPKPKRRTRARTGNANSRSRTPSSS